MATTTLDIVPIRSITVESLWNPSSPFLPPFLIKYLEFLFKLPHIYGHPFFAELEFIYLSVPLQVWHDLDARIDQEDEARLSKLQAFSVWDNLNLFKRESRNEWSQHFRHSWTDVHALDGLIVASGYWLHKLRCDFIDDVNRECSNTKDHLVATDNLINKLNLPNMDRRHLFRWRLVYKFPKEDQAFIGEFLAEEVAHFTSLGLDFTAFLKRPRRVVLRDFGETAAVRFAPIDDSVLASDHARMKKAM